MKLKNIFYMILFSLFVGVTVLVSCEKEGVLDFVKKPIIQKLLIDAPITVSKNDLKISANTTPSVYGFSPVSGYTPEEGIPGTTITIHGSNFNFKTLGNEVRFNGVKAMVSIASPTELTAIVPTGATTGRIAVTVNGFITTSSTDFIINKQFRSVPVITSFFPFSFSQTEIGSGGKQILIAGANFSASPMNNIVRFQGDSRNAFVLFSTKTQLTVVVPERIVTGPVTVSVDGVTGISFQPITVTSF